ncbi:MAG: peptidase M22 [Bacillota bacterium]|nr:peptidase M22 [Bacillota bacterium]
MNSRYILGIDTSNYKTSIAVVDNDYNIVCDLRNFLEVRKGERGLRQSEALFQHVQNLPELMERIPVDLDGKLDAVAWSNRPRPVENSYMPVFNAGISTGRSIAAVNGVLGIGFSHQEGHIEAVKHDTGFESDEPFLACHFSGGTTEIVIVKPRDRDVVLNTGVFYKIFLVGGTRDIAYGQLIDRAGVAFGYRFPAGEILDKIACSCDHATNILTPIKCRHAYFNISGIDTQIKRCIEDEGYGNEKESFIKEIFLRIGESIKESIYQAANMTEINKVVMSGGVMSSRFIREYISNSPKLKDVNVYFGDNNMSQDNAVGLAVLGGRYVWD